MTGYLVKLAKKIADKACVYVWKSNVSAKNFGHIAIKIDNEYWSFTGDVKSRPIANFSRTDFPGAKPGTKISFFKKLGKFNSMKHDFDKRGNPSYSYFIDIESPRLMGNALTDPYYQIANSVKGKNDHNNCMDTVIKTLMEHTSDQDTKEQLLGCLNKAKSVEELSRMLKNKFNTYSSQSKGKEVYPPDIKDL